MSSSVIKSDANFISNIIILSTVPLAALLGLTYIPSIAELGISYWLLLHIVVYALIFKALDPFKSYCESDELDESPKCNSLRGGVILAVIPMVVAVLVLIVYLVILLVNIIQLGCAGINACNTDYAAYFAVWVLVIVYILIMIFVILYTFWKLRSSLTFNVGSKATDLERDSGGFNPVDVTLVDTDKDK